MWKSLWKLEKKRVRCWNCDAQMTPGHQCERQSDKIEVEDEERRKTESEESESESILEETVKQQQHRERLKMLECTM